MSKRLYDGVWDSFTGTIPERLVMLYLAFKADEEGLVRLDLDDVANAASQKTRKRAQAIVTTLTCTMWLKRESDTHVRLAVDRLRWKSGDSHDGNLD